MSDVLMILAFQLGVECRKPYKVTNGSSEEKSFIQGYDANEKQGLMLQFRPKRTPESLTNQSGPLEKQ